MSAAGCSIGCQNAAAPRRWPGGGPSSTASFPTCPAATSTMAISPSQSRWPKMGALFRPTLFPPPSSAPVRVELTKKQLDLVWDMNRDLTPREFDQFIETARALGLSPLSRQ